MRRAVLAGGLLVVLVVSVLIRPATGTTPAHFHHVHVNATNPAKTQEFYEKTFGAQPIRFKGTVDGLFTSRGFILINKVDATPRDIETTSIRHIGWAGIDGPGEFAGFKARGAAGEELGWTGFALPALRARLSPLPAALVLGAVWAVWHFIPLVEAHRAPGWIAWWTLGTVANRVVMVWLYERAGRSLSGQVVVHAMSNLCWQLYPVQGSWFDPRIHGLVMAALAAILTVTAYWSMRASRSSSRSNRPRQKAS